MRYILLFFLIQVCVQVTFGQLSSREYFKLGKNKYDENQFFDAIDFLDKAIEVDTAYESAIFLRGVSFLELKKFSLAIRDFDKVIEMRKSNDSYEAEYFLKRAIARTELRDYREAEKDFTMALKLNPGNADIYYEYAQYKYVTLSDKNEAIHELDIAIQHDPDIPEYYVRRAEYKVYLAKYGFNSDELYKSALRDISFAITQDPDNFNYYLIRSDINKERGQPVEALADYNKMIEINPDRAEAYSARGILKMQNDQYRSAIDDFTKSIELNDQEEKNFRYRALCKYNIQNYNGAYDDYSVSIDILKEKMNANTGVEQLHIKRLLADTYIKRGAAATFLGNSLNACADFRIAYQLGSNLGLNYLRKYCGI